MNRQVKSLTNSIARADLIFMAIESLILFLVIENIGKLTDIYFVGKGSIVVTLSYFLLLIFFFTTPAYKAPFILLSGFEHYSKAAIDLLKIFTILAFEFFVFNLQAGRAFFIFALPIAILLRLLGRKSLKMLYGRQVRDIPVFVFTEKDYIKKYLQELFTNVKLEPENTFSALSESMSRFSNSLVLLHNSKDFSREHDQYASFLVSKGITLGYLDSYTRVKGRVGLQIVLGALVVLIRQPVQASRSMRVSKRIFDICVSGLVLVVLLPVGPFFYVLFRISNGSPVIFKQPRVGLDGKLFTLYKVRTIDSKSQLNQISADQPDTWAPKPHTDALVPWGKFLRRWSLDELPQLVNVLKGDMSLVGPRPRLQSEESQSGFRLRLSVKPGLTGLWQISGRNLVSPTDAEELDDYYIDHWSFLMDIQISAKTFTAIRNGLGAR
jgi:lipopolysaccharide/colanic/teichoic acid biosynthesis glycosyltransferase